MRSILKKLLKYSKKITKEDENVIDVILFGSLSRGKREYNDVDVCVIFRKKIEREIIDEIEKIDEKIHVSYLTVDNFFRKYHKLASVLLLEGTSLTKEKKLSEIYGFIPKVIYKYELKSLKPSQKTMFLRGLKNIKKEIRFEMIGKGILEVPIEKDEKMREYFDFWKVKYKRMKIFKVR